MKDDPIPNEDHVSRYCPFGKLRETDGKPGPQAFKLRKKQNEPYISVNWLEFHDPDDRGTQIEAIRKVFESKDYDLGSKGKFAVLEVGKTKREVKEKISDRRDLGICHLPDPSIPDDSHSGIFNVNHTEDGLMIAKIIADCVEELYKVQK